MTWSQIRKIAPNYRGKRKEFDPSKVKAKANKPQDGAEKPRSNKPPVLEKLPEARFQSENASKPTPQKNEPMWADSIFGVDVALRELTPTEEFSPGFQRLPVITKEIYTNVAADDTQVNKKFTLEMLDYYATTLLWARLIDLKAKRANVELTQTEMNFRRYFLEEEFNVPQPLYLYIKAIGEVTDKRGKKLHLVDHVLPVTRSQNKTGYHSNTINDESHNLYGEIPTLGVIGDVLQALTSADAAPVPDIPILPAGTVATRNLLGFPGVIGVRRDEIKQTLNSFGITTDRFDENVTNTRFNIQLVQYMSRLIGNMTTFRIEKVNVSKLTTDGSDVQLILSRPSTTENTADVLWRDNIVQPRTVSADSVATVGASYMTGFQVEKATIMESNSNWCTVAAAPQSPWVIPATWIANRNERRALPNNYAIDRLFSELTKK